MPFSEVALAIPIILFAYLIRGVAGFGSALIAVPMMCLWLPLEMVVPIVVLFDYLSSLTQGSQSREHIVWREIKLIIPFSIVGIATAIFLLSTVDTRSLMRALGLFIIAYSLYQLLPVTKHKGSRVFAPPAGVFAGLAGTLFGTGGPFYVTYLMIRKLTKAEFRATFATLFVIDGSVRIIALALAGFYTLETGGAALMLLPFAAIGLLAGNYIHLDISVRNFKMLISILLFATSIPLIVR